MPAPPASRVLASYRESVAGLDRRVLVVAGGSFLTVAGRMSLVTFLAIYFVTVVHLPIALVGSGFLVENVARGLFAPISGALSDRVGRKPVLLVGIGGLALTLPLFLLVTNGLELVAWSFALGLFGAIQQPASSALLLDLVPPDRRQRALALNYSAIAIGYTLGVAPAGFLAQRSYAWLALGSALLLSFAFALFVFGLRGPLPRETSGGDDRVGLARQLSLAPRDRTFLAFAACAIVFPIALGLTTTTSTVFAADRGLSDGAIGLILSLNGVLLALFALPIQARIERAGPFRLLGGSAIVLAASFVLLGLVPAIAWGMTLHVVAFTLGEFFFGPTVPAAVAVLAPRGARGAYQGAWGFLWALGYGGALFLAGILQPLIGWGSFWLLSAIVSIACGLALLAGRARFRSAAEARAGGP